MFLPMNSVTDFLAVAIVLGLAFAVRIGFAYWRAKRTPRS